jgi:hypothetical protein
MNYATDDIEMNAAGQIPVWPSILVFALIQINKQYT